MAEAVARRIAPAQRLGVAVLLSTLLLLLSACAVLRGSSAAATFLAPSQQHLRFTAGFNDAHRTSVAYRDPSEYEEYDRLVGAAQAEAILSVANGPNTSLEFPVFRLKSLTQSWSVNQKNARLRWGAPRYLDDGGQRLAYARYQREAAGKTRACVAFLRAWDSPPDDPRHRPGKAFFGYYCAPAGARLTLSQTQRVLRGIAVDTSAISQVYYGQRLPADPGALSAARGPSGSAIGNPHFPFQFSRYYNIGDHGNTFH